MRKFTAVMLHLRDDFALPIKPPVAFGYKPFSFGRALPRALSVHMRNIGENLLSRFRRVRHNTALGPPSGQSAANDRGWPRYGRWISCGKVRG